MRKALVAVVLGASLCLGLHADEENEGEVPPIPTPTFEDPALGAEYDEGVKLIEAEEYKKAEKIFKRLRRVAPEGEPRDGAERCYLEAKGGIALQKIRADIRKEQWRKALAACEDATEEYAGTHAGEKIADLQELCTEEVFYVIDDFEKEKEGEKEERPEGGGVDPGRWGRGESGYGLNSKVVEGTRKEGTVRQGDRALEWLTTRDFAFISFDDLPKNIEEGHRYLVLSIRAKDAKKAPPLRILFDCQEGFGWGGDRGGRGGRRGGARALNRIGFHTSIATSGKWQDLRLDLRKFNPSGDATWGDVLALRIIHMPGSDGRILIDNVRLEKK